jgi:hypothetical protein
MGKCQLYIRTHFTKDFGGALFTFGGEWREDSRDGHGVDSLILESFGCLPNIRFVQGHERATIILVPTFYHDDATAYVVS